MTRCGWALTFCMSDSFFRLCGLEELSDPGSREFSWGEDDWPLEFFVVRSGGEVFGFVNQCPHQGHALNWQPDRFLTREGDLILCNSHGARFRIVDGMCVSGPCPGASLRSVTLTMKDGQVMADENELRALLAQRTPDAGVDE